MFAGSVLVLFWCLITVIGAISGLAFILGMKGL